MNIEIKKNDAKVVVNILKEVHNEWYSVTKKMQEDKKCSLEKYNEHLDSCGTLGIIIQQMEKLL